MTEIEVCKELKAGSSVVVVEEGPYKGKTGTVVQVSYLARRGAKVQLQFGKELVTAGFPPLALWNPNKPKDPVIEDAIAAERKRADAAEAEVKSLRAEKARTAAAAKEKGGER